MRSSTDLDKWLTEERRPEGALLERTLNVARQELARNPPVRRWRTEALWVFAASALMTAAVAGVLLVLGSTSVAFLLGRAPLLLLLWVTSAVCAWGAMAPRGRAYRLGGVGLALASAFALVLARGTGSEATLPGWVCTASHVGMGLVPLVAAVVLLRGAAFRPVRALLAGLSVGTTGAFVGELACAQGWRHVLGYHLSAWALVAAATFFVSRTLVPRSFAP